MLRFDGLVLAGGRSTRMGGRHKGDLVYQNHTFTEHIIKELKRETDNVWLSYGTEKKQEYEGCRSITDVYPDCGPIGGIHAGLRVCKGDGVMAAACDMPLLEMELFRYLAGRMEQAEREPGGYFLGAVPVTAGKIHPLAAVYRTGMRKIFEKQIESGNYRVTDALKRAGILYVDVTEKERFVRMLRNVNTFPEYEALIRTE